MKNIKLLKLEKLSYQEIENGIYKDLNDLEETNYRIAISFELEESETFQYPLEDILDKYFLYVSDIMKNTSEQNNLFEIELAGELEDIQSVKKIIGKRVFNQILRKEDGQNYITLVIE